MGRPYAREIAELEATYAWALGVDTSALESAILRAVRWPLVVVGSGGALTSAHAMTQLHRDAAGALAVTTTPLLLESVLPTDGQVAVWLLSAGGRNVDIRYAFRRALASEPRQLAVVCGSPDSPLMRDTSSYQWVDRLPLLLPTSDGFLATNSVLAFLLLLSRGYGSLGERALPTLGDLLDASHPEHRTLEDRCASLWSRPTLIVLHGASTAPAAFDLESRFTEAALGIVQLADFRNFAHGRHHWLAKHGSTTAVLALVGPDDRRVARETLALLPSDVPAVALEFGGALSHVMLGSIVTAMNVARLAGAARAIDPGRPGVPDFGRRLYHMKRSRSEATRTANDGDDAKAMAAIRRKARTSPVVLRTHGMLGAWRQAYATFTRKLGDASFTGVVCDYDGTLLDSRARNEPPSEEVVTFLRQLLREGIVVGIATGRGDSVATGLRAALAEEEWSSVFVGYHNGATVRRLADPPHLADGTPAPNLSDAVAVLEGERLFQGIADVRTSADQITVSPSLFTSEEQLWLLVSDAIRRAGIQGLRVLRSSHSVDVIPASSSKLRVVEAVKQAAPRGELLTIGDRGCWPGNDFELLSTPYALSVDEVSPDPAGAWNLAPEGQRGVGALLAYARAVRLERGVFRVDPSEIRA
jgi:hypothetical protein